MTTGNLLGGLGLLALPFMERLEKRGQNRPSQAEEDTENVDKVV